MMCFRQCGLYNELFFLVGVLLQFIQGTAEPTPRSTIETLLTARKNCHPTSEESGGTMQSSKFIDSFVC